MADRYCRNCGHGLAEDDRFCPNCGRPVHEVAHVPTTEADVPVSPPQRAGSAAQPRQDGVSASQGRRSGLGIIHWFNERSDLTKLIAALAALVTIVLGLRQIYEWYVPPTSHLTFEDVGFLKHPHDYPLDIKLSNTGKGTAFITQADLKIKRMWTLTPPYRSGTGCAFVRPSHNYEFELPTSGAPFVRKLGLSQSVGQGSVDRFTIGFDYDNPKQVNFKDYVFLATLSLVYGKGDKRVSKDVLFASSQVDCSLFYKTGKGRALEINLTKSDAARLDSQNKQNMEEIKQIHAVKSDYVQQLITTGDRPNFASASASATASATASASTPPEPTEQNGGGSQDGEDVHDTDEKIELGDVAYTVTHARQITQLKDTCGGAKYSVGPPKTGNFILVDFFVTNNSKQRVRYRDVGLNLYDSKGRQYEPKDTGGYLCEDKDIFFQMWVDPNTSQEAEAVYSVPPDASGFEFEVASASGHGEVGRIKLGF